MTTPALELDDVGVALPVGGRQREIIRSVSLAVAAGEALGLVGESGSGKSMTLRAVLGLLPAGAQATGTVRCGGEEISALTERQRRAFRSAHLATVFQDPRTSLNPVRRVGDFLTEELRARGGGRAAVTARAIALLEDVGIDDPARRLRQYPHELSGGMLQRVVIAAALASEPSVLLADEPTTALDVTTQAEVMAILDARRRERRMAMLFVTHDLDLAVAVCDRIAVMYAGRIVAIQPAASLRDRPSHPYTKALLGSRPSIDETVARLDAIPGRPVSAFEAPAGCAFAPRCPHREARCETTEPALRAIGGAWSACLRADELVESAEHV
jgi:oligopeptide/dipeptide ABC transporter ATP-binding protein